MIVLHPFIFHSSGGGAQDLCSEAKIHKVDFAKFIANWNSHVFLYYHKQYSVDFTNISNNIASISEDIS